MLQCKFMHICYLYSLTQSKSNKREGECPLYIYIVLYNTVASPGSYFTGCRCMIKSDCTGTVGCIKLTEVYRLLSSVMGTIPCRQSMYMYQHTCHWLCQCSKSACHGVQVPHDQK